MKNSQERNDKEFFLQLCLLFMITLCSFYFFDRKDLFIYSVFINIILLIPSKMYFNVPRKIINKFFKTNSSSLNNKFSKILDKIDYEKSISTDKAKDLINLIIDIKINHSFKMVDFNLLTKSFLLLNYYSKNNTETVNIFDSLLYSLSYDEDSSTNYNTSKLFDFIDNDKNDILFHKLFINNSAIFKKYYNSNKEYMNKIDSQFKLLLNNVSTNDLKTDTNVNEDLLKKFKINNSTLKMYSSK